MWARVSIDKELCSGWMLAVGRNSGSASSCPRRSALSPSLRPPPAGLADEQPPSPNCATHAESGSLSVYAQSRKTSGGVNESEKEDAAVGKFGANAREKRAREKRRTSVEEAMSSSPPLPPPPPPSVANESKTSSAAADATTSSNAAAAAIPSAATANSIVLGNGAAAGGPSTAVSKQASPSPSPARITAAAAGDAPRTDVKGCAYLHLLPNTILMYVKKLIFSAKAEPCSLSNESGKDNIARSKNG
ncbi:hypothetical protein V9T40_004881 [Parthenolecanium corni]|uniref:Uncharacterized protein n=1 Tax=Parthenolecanium corni TaxID=536013 RepID=A0AAN9TCT3_9HEMI